MGDPGKTSSDQESFKDVVLGADGVYRVVEAAEAASSPAGTARAAATAPPESSAPQHDSASPTQASPAMTEPPPVPPRRRNLSNLALLSLVAFLAGGALTLWIAPKLAPLMPKPIARFLMPARDAEREALAAMSQRLDAFGTELNRLGAAVGSVGGLEAQLEALSADLAKLRAAPAPENPAPRLAALDEKAKALENAVAALASQPAQGGPDTARVTALEGRVSALAQAVSAASVPQPDAAAALAIGALERRLAVLESKPAPVSHDAELAGRVDALEAQMNELGKGDLSAAVTVATADLQTAMMGSAPFMTQLENFESLSGLHADEALRIYARTGLTTLATLASGFDAAANAAVAAEGRDQARATENLGGKLGSAVSSMVTVRRTAESIGLDTVSILARARARIAEDDLASAMRDLEALAPAPRAAMEAWLSKAQARLNAEDSFARLRRRLTAQ